MDRGVSFFMGLPTEILQQIVNYAEHRDIESVSLSCRLLRDLAKTKLAQHRVLERRFSSIESDYNHYRSSPGQHPIQLLEIILDDPVIALYPAQITIGFCHHQQDDIDIIVDADLLHPGPYKQTHKDEFGSQVYRAVESYCFHVPRCRKGCLSIPWDHLAERVLAHHQSPTFALLLTRLVNLEILTFVGSQSRPLRILKVVSDIVDSNYKFPRTSSVVQPLSKLHTIVFRTTSYDHLWFPGYGSAAPSRVPVLTGLSFLQSVDTITSREDSTFVTWPWKMPAASQNLQMRLGRTLHESLSAAFIAGTRNLREFHMNNSSFNPVQTVKTLLRYASHSLVSLTLTGPYLGSDISRSSWYKYHCHGYVGSLRAFKGLTSIRIDVPMLIDSPSYAAQSDGDESSSGETDSESSEEEASSTWYLDAAEKEPIVHQLINVLPASTESLALEMLASRTIMLQMLSKLPRRKADRLPNLKEISYECEERIVIGMEAECEAVGLNIVQVLKYGDFKNFRRDSLPRSDASSDMRFVDYDCWCCTSGGCYRNQYYEPYEYYEDPEIERYNTILADAEEFYTEQVCTDEELTQVYEDIEDFEWRIAQAGDLV